MKKLAVIILSFLSLHTYEQGFNFKLYNQSSGIISSNVKKIQQDSYGFIWMGTQDGLTRFDGKNSLMFDKPELDGNDISDLYFDPHSKYLWIGYSQGGVSAINTTTLRTEFSLKKLNCYSKIKGFLIRSILMDSKERLWIGTDSGLYIMPHILKDSLVSLPENFENAHGLNWIIKIAEDKSSNVLVAVSNGGIIVYNKGNYSYQNVYSLPVKAVTVLYACYDFYRHVFLLSTSKGIYNFDINTKVTKLLNINYPSEDQKTTLETVYCARYDDQQRLWVSANSGLFILNKDSSLNKINVTGNQRADFGNIPVDILFDYDHNIWISSRNGCFYSNAASSPFTKYIYSDNKNLLNHLYSLFPQEKSLLACDENGLYKLDYTTQTVKVCDSNKLYYLFFKDFKGNTFCSNQNGVFLWDDKRNKLTKSIDLIYPEFSSYKQNVFCCILSFGDSLLVLGSDNSTGIYLWNIKQHNITNINKGASLASLASLRSGTVNMLYKIDNHSFWILSDSFIETFDLNTFKTRDVTSSFPDIDFFFDIVTIASKSYIACYGTGVLEVDSNLKVTRVFSKPSGLSNNCVYRLIPESDSVMWVTTNFGLNRINLITGKISKFYTEDGLNSNEFEEFSASYYSGKIFAGGLKGFTIIDPSKILTNDKPPSLYFTNISVRSKAINWDSSDLQIKVINIPNDWLQANISFVGLNYTDPQGVIYQYRIKEQDTSWINNNGNNFISIMGLSPGTYTLEVKAANEHGIWSKSKQLKIIFEPKWNQTLLFKISLVVATAVLFYMLYLYRIKQIKTQVLIRKNIASDLHDDIGSTLNTSKVFIHLAKRNPGKSEYLNQIEEYLTEAIIGLRDMIWILDDSQDTLDELIERIKKFAIPVSTAKNIYFECKQEIQGKNQKLSKIEKRNLFLMAKEIINNSIKYAECRYIKVLLTQYADKRVLQISDDGIGFSYLDVPKGNGLNNLHHRSQQIGYRIDITSSPGNGTLIKISKSK